MAKSRLASNKQHLDRLQGARAKADQIQAKADAARAKALMVHADIRSKGKDIVWDPKTGNEKVVDRKGGA